MPFNTNPVNCDKNELFIMNWSFFTSSLMLSGLILGKSIQVWINDARISVFWYENGIYYDSGTGV